MKKLTILANYSKTRQHSIQLYADNLYEIMKEALPDWDVNQWSQKGLFARFSAKSRYFIDLDKYIIAPLECLFRKTDVLHIADNSNAWYSFFFRKNKLIVSCHDMISYVAARGEAGPWQPSIFARALMVANIWAMKRADRIVCVSQTSADVLVKIGIPKDRIEVIHNAILHKDFGTLQGGGDDAEAEPTAFLHFGAGKYTKNTPLLIEAFDLLCSRAATPPKLALVGGGAERARERSAYPQHVIAHKSVSALRIQKMYESGIAMVMPSFYEGFGLPVIEGQSLGCPVITSDGGALDEVNGNPETKLKTPISAEALASLMEKIWLDQDFRASVIEEGYRNKDRFTIERFRNGYTNMIVNFTRSMTAGRGR